ncbi:UNVERIFIED_ORG: hypothetical protein GGE36_004748 [Rhizobium etli]
MTIASLDDRTSLGKTGDLAEAGQRVELAENCDDGTTFTRLSHDSGGNAGHASGDLPAIIGRDEYERDICARSGSAVDVVRGWLAHIGCGDLHGYTAHSVLRALH